MFIIISHIANNKNSDNRRTGYIHTSYLDLFRGLWRLVRRPSHRPPNSEIDGSRASSTTPCPYAPMSMLSDSATSWTLCPRPLGMIREPLKCSRRSLNTYVKKYIYLRKPQHKKVLKLKKKC